MKTVMIKGKRINLFDTAYDVSLARDSYYGEELGDEIRRLLEYTHFSWKSFSFNKPFVVCPFTFLEMVEDNPVYVKHDGKLYALIGYVSDYKEETKENQISKNFILVNCDPAYSLYVRNSICDDPGEYNYVEHEIYETKNDAELAGRHAINGLFSEQLEFYCGDDRDGTLFEEIHEIIMGFAQNTGMSIKDSCHSLGIILQMTCEEIAKMPELTPCEKRFHKALATINSRIMATDFVLKDLN